MTTTTPDLTSQPERFVCPACLTRAMQISVDKKSRPFFFCTGCEATIVLKHGMIGVGNITTTLRLLNDDRALTAVREEGTRSMARGLLAMVGEATAPTSTPARVPTLPATIQPPLARVVSEIRHPGMVNVNESSHVEKVETPLPQNGHVEALTQSEATSLLKPTPVPVPDYSTDPNDLAY